VNLLPYSVFESLNLGELKPTSVTLLLADRSVKVPRGIVEDVVVQVDKFIYLVYFVVLDTQPIEACNETSTEIEFNESEDLQMVYFQEESKASNWRPQIKELPPRSIESISSSVQPPKPDLKPLPFNLKYSFLEENETFPVIMKLFC